MCEWILVLCRSLYTESKRKWLIKQRSKELTRRKEEQEERNDKNERNYESNRE
jgi:hypothetical protein